MKGLISLLLTTRSEVFRQSGRRFSADSPFNSTGLAFLYRSAETLCRRLVLACRTLSYAIGPLALSLDAQTSSDLLKGHLHLPPPEEPLQNLLRLLVELSAEQCAR